MEENILKNTHIVVFQMLLYMYQVFVLLNKHKLQTIMEKEAIAKKCVHLEKWLFFRMFPFFFEEEESKIFVEVMS